MKRILLMGTFLVVLASLGSAGIASAASSVDGTVDGSLIGSSASGTVGGSISGSTIGGTVTGGGSSGGGGSGGAGSFPSGNGAPGIGGGNGSPTGVVLGASTTTNPTVPGIPNTGEGGNAAFNWMIVFLGTLSAALITYITARRVVR